MVLHVVWTELIFEVFISAQCGRLSSRACFWAVTMGVAFFLSVLGLFLGSFQQPGPTTSHLQLFPALAVSVISAPMVSLSSTLRAVSCPLPSTAAAISAILFSCYQLSLWRWERPLMRTLLFLYFHYTRGCAGGCVLARECAVRILALIMADFMQMKDCFCRYEP